MTFATPTKLVANPDDADKLLVIDSSNLAWRSMHAYSLNTSTGKPSGHVYGAVTLLLTAIRTVVGGGNVCLVFCYEGWNAKKKRQELVPDYKGNREKRDFNPLKDVERIFRCVPGMQMKVEEREADDCIAWASTYYYDKDVIVMSGDKDLWSLTALPNTRVWSPNKGDFVTTAMIEDEYGIKDPTKIPLCKALFGDASDNIKGILRLQKKQVLPIINECAHSTIGHFYSRVKNESWDCLKPNSLKKVLEEEDRINRNFEIILPMLAGIEPGEITEGTAEDANLFRLILEEFECRSLLKEVPAIYGGAIYARR